MPLLTSLSRLSIALMSLLAVGCGAADSERSYSADLNVEAPLIETEATAAAGCEEGAVQTCKIYLGRHGDLNNCVSGLAICTGNEWGQCVDENSMNDNPELYADLMAADDSNSLN